MAKHLRPDEVAQDIRDQQRMLSPSVQKRFHDQVIAPLMVTMVKFNFQRGKDPEGKLWKTWSAKGKYNDRWSEAYNTRPSGHQVSADKTRLTDTSILSDSYRDKTVTSTRVVVGPTGNRNTKIAENEESHGNAITGWGRDAIRVLTAEIQEFVDRMAEGRFPQSRPSSRVGFRGGF